VRPLAAVLVLLAALVLAACGSAGTDSSTKFQGDQREVASTIEDLQSAASADDPSKICRSLLARTLLDRIGTGPQCQKVVETAIDAADTNELDVKSVSVTGTSATARVTSGKGDGATTRTVHLEREGSNWKIAAL
jgi:outer membrane PBP1 activator LpoA protein